MLPALLLTAAVLAGQAPDSTAEVESSNITSEMVHSLDAPDGMVLIPAGTFEMGSDWKEMKELAEFGKKVPHMSIGHARWWYGDETPRHEVYVEPFLLDVHEVTNSEYREFVNETHYLSEGNWYEFAGEGRNHHPVVGVSWHDAVAYAEWAGKRLPTEEEWEYAALGGTDHRHFPWGETITEEDARWRYEGESFFDGIVRLIGLRKLNTAVVGSYEPNGYGLYDMVGNACEWTSSPYTVYPGFEQHPDGPYSEVVEMTAEESNARRVVRGGSWDSSNQVFMRIRNRHGFEIDHSNWILGFRCAKSLP
jgi:formylglycine-generating enzyme required for sulfatase activity